MADIEKKAKETETDERLRSRSIELMTDLADLPRLLNSTKQLTDEAYEEFLNDNGFRLVVWHFRRAAVTGNTRTAKACQIWLERYDRTQANSGKRKPAARDVTAPTAFVSSPRLDSSDTPDSSLENPAQDADPIEDLAIDA